jgi:hypothetical protein
LNFAASALYLLSAPSTPESAREEAIDRAEAGEVMTHAKAKAIIAAHRQNETERFSLRSQPTSDEPIPPQPDSASSSLGRWIERVYEAVLTFQHPSRAHELAITLTETQRRKLFAIREFLQKVEEFDAEAAVTDGEAWLNDLIQSIRQVE